MSNKPNIIPQIGWNNLKIIEKRNKLFEDINEKDFFYFVHSYKFCLNNKKELIASTDYNETFSIHKFLSFILIWIAVSIYLKDLYEHN